MLDLNSAFGVPKNTSAPVVDTNSTIDLHSAFGVTNNASTPPVVNTTGVAQPPQQQLHLSTEPPTLLDKVENYAVDSYKNLPMNVADTASQVDNAIIGTAANTVAWVGDKLGVSTPMSDSLIKIYEKHKSDWEKAHPGSFNIGEIAGDITTPMGAPSKAADGAIGLWKFMFSKPALKEMLSGGGKVAATVDEAANLTNSFLVNVGMLKKNKIENPEDWAAAFTAAGPVLSLVGKGGSKLVEYNVNRYIHDVLHLTDDQLNLTLEQVSKFRNFDHLTPMQKKIVATIYKSPQAMASIKNILMTSDEASSNLMAHTKDTTDKVLNSTGVSATETGRALEDVANKVQTQYGQNTGVILKELGDIPIDMTDIKQAVSDYGPQIEKDLIGNSSSIATLNKIINSKPTTVEELTQLGSSLGKVERKFKKMNQNSDYLSFARTKIKEQTDAQMFRTAQEDSHKFLSKVIRMDNKSYAILKEKLMKSPIWKGIIDKNLPQNKAIDKIVSVITSDSSTQLTKDMVDTFDFIGHNMDRDLFERSLVQNIIEKSVSSADNMGGKAIDFVKLSETLDKVPEGVFRQPGTHALIDTYQSLADLEKGSLDMVRTASRFTGDNAEQMQKVIGQTLGFSLKLKVSQALAKMGIKLVHAPSAYASRLEEVLNGGFNTPLMLDKIHSNFSSILDAKGRHDILKAARETGALYQESIRTNNIEVSKEIAPTSNYTYFKQMADAYGNGKAKEMFNMSKDVQVVNGLPVQVVNDKLGFTWHRIGNEPISLTGVSPRLQLYLGDSRTIKLGETTNMTGKDWTISREDLANPRELTQKALNILDKKLKEANHVLTAPIGSKEVRQLTLGQKMLISDDLEQQLTHAGVRDKFGIPRINEYQDRKNITIPTKEGSDLLLMSKTDGDGVTHWTMNTMGMPKNSGTKTYKALFDWIHSLGPKNTYAPLGLTDINMWRNSFHKIDSVFRQGGVDTFDMGYSMGTTSETTKQSVDSFKKLIVNLDKEVQRNVGINKSVRDMTDEELTATAKAMPMIESNKGLKHPAGARSLGNLRTALKWADGEDVTALDTVKTVKPTTTSATISGTALNNEEWFARVQANNTPSQAASEVNDRFDLGELTPDEHSVFIRRINQGDTAAPDMSDISETNKNWFNNLRSRYNNTLVRAHLQNRFSSGELTPGEFGILSQILGRDRP